METFSTKQNENVQLFFFPITSPLTGMETTLAAACGLAIAAGVLSDHISPNGDGNTDRTMVSDDF